MAETTVTINGEKRSLKLAFDQLVCVEENLDKGLFQLGREAAMQTMGVREISVIVWQGLVGSGEDPEPTLDQVKEIIAKAGAGIFLSPITDLLVGWIAGKDAVNRAEPDVLEDDESEDQPETDTAGPPEPEQPAD